MEKIVEKKVCKHCDCKFDITDNDMKFYQQSGPFFGGKKYNIPSPNICYNCRAQNMLAIRNERNLYKRICDATGKEIVTIHRPGNHVKVYDQEYWRGDKWNPLDYGIEIDFNKSFFKQFGKLFKVVPQISLNAHMSEKSYFTNQCEGNKECYMMFCTSTSDNCYYGMWNQNCKYCIDCLYVEFCENCYEVINAKNSYKCYFSKNLEDCAEIFSSSNLINCKNCIGCVNLESKQYYIFNKKYSREEYFKKIKEFKLDSFLGIKKINKKFLEFENKFPCKYYNGKKNDRFSGDYIENSKKTYYAFNCRDNEESKYCRDSWRITKSYDLVETLSIQHSYIIEGSGYVTKSLFCKNLMHCSNVYYSSHCSNSQNLFGCVGIKNGSYCILNKQYTKEEYLKLVPKIIKYMESINEWGEMLPVSISPFGYNESVAQEYFPLEKKEALKLGYKWSDYETLFKKVEKIIPANKLPNYVSEIPDDILNWAIKCETSDKPFKIIKQELKFYRKHNLPVPRKHHNQRHLDRMEQRNPRKLFDRKCDKCSIEMKTTYSPNIKQIVFCEECYNKEIY